MHPTGRIVLTVFQINCTVLPVLFPPWAGTRFVPPVSGSEMTCELEFSIPDDDKFFDDKVRGDRMIACLYIRRWLESQMLMQCGHDLHGHVVW